LTAIKAGAISGFFFGFLFTIGYTGASVLLCGGIRDCPDQAGPYIITGAIVWVGTIIAFTAGLLFLHRVYRLFKVT
jgi:hypothetical protein